MTFSSSLTEEDRQLVLDSSVVINLLATEKPAPILSALAMPISVTDNVIREIELGGISGRPDASLLNDLIAKKILRVGQLEGPPLQMFFGLVSGSTSESLGDGEAATLAFAYGTGCSAVIDEKKATRLSASRFASLRLATTIDILGHASVRSALGHAALAEATFQALRMARMQVREHQFDWVVKLIGERNVAACTSLKRLATHRARCSHEKITS